MTNASREFLSLLGYVFLEHGQGAKAVTVYEALHALDPDDPATSRRLAFAYLMDDRFVECLRHGDAHMDRFPTDPQLETIRLARGRALWNLGRQNEARRVAKRSLGV
jgi:regulator of sirC expression with transglutaminase-like and TPR domain